MRVERPSRAGEPIASLGFADLLAVQREPASVTLTWQAISPVAEDYTVFVHVLDAAGKIVAQHDSQPAASAWPTSAWRPGQIVVDPHPLVVPPDARRLEVGLYLLSTGQRAGGGSYVAEL